MKKRVLLMKKPSLLSFCPQYSILLKGGALPPGSIRVWGGKEYVKIAPGKWRLKKVAAKEPWDSSNEKAKSLRMADFGTFDQFRDISHMERTPETYNQAREILSNLVDIPMVSRSGLEATLSKKSIDKILSGKSVASSYDFKSHLLAAGNIDKLYTNAIEPWDFEMNPGKHNAGLANIHRLFAPMEYEGQIVIVKITVKKMENPKDGNRIYTIKAVDVI